MERARLTVLLERIRTPAKRRASLAVWERIASTVTPASSALTLGLTHQMRLVVSRAETDGSRGRRSWDAKCARPVVREPTVDVLRARRATYPMAIARRALPAMLAPTQQIRLGRAMRVRQASQM